MATTVTAATLTVNIQESITLNGVTYDKTTIKSIASVANYHSRVVQLKSVYYAYCSKFGCRS